MPVRFVLLALVLAASAAPSAQTPVFAQTPFRGQMAEDLAIREAIAEYEQTGVARVIEIGQTILAPYNQIDPVLKTALLRTTLVELDLNEYVVDRFIGDSLRWSVDFGVTGSEGNFRQIVSIKPRDQDITTSLVLTTNTGRIYQFTLDSEPYPINQNQNPVGIPYTAHVRFYYPDDGMPPDPLAAAQAAADPGLLWTSTGGAPGAYTGDGYGGALNTDYEVRTDDGFPCAPTFVGDDGIRLIIRFPDTAEDPFCSTRFPLYDVGERGDLQLLNYSLMGGNTYVTERMPAEARILFLTSRGERREVRIRSRAAMARAPRRPIGLVLDGRIGTAFPTDGSAFRNSYDAGLDVGGSIGYRASRALTVSLQGRYGRLPTDGTFVRDAVESALDATLAPAIAGRLRTAGVLADGEQVALFSQARGGDVRTGRLSLALRLSLATESRFEPYLGARVGVLRRTARAVDLDATGLVVGADGTRRNDPALDAEIAASFAGGAAGSDAAQADPAYTAFVDRLGGAYDQNLVVPSWLVGASDAELGPEIGGGLGLLVHFTRAFGAFVEVEYTYSPIGSRADRSVAPFTFGLRADF